MMRALQSPRLMLEPQTALHAPAMFELLSDPAIYTYENQPPASLDALTQRFQRLESQAQLLTHRAPSPRAMQRHRQQVARRRKNGKRSLCDLNWMVDMTATFCAKT